MAMTPERVQQALALWNDFPVGRNPRPIVLISPFHGWLATFQALTGRLQMDALPAAPEVELSPSQMADVHRYYGTAQTGTLGQLGRIARIDVPTSTDRGDQRLPSLAILPDGQRRPFIMLDPTFRQDRTWWPSELTSTYETQVATIAEDDRTLTFRFIARPKNQVDIPNAVVTETATAVHVDPVQIDVTKPGYDYVAMAEEREVVAHLAAPLGNRVLIADNGSPVIVVPDTPSLTNLAHMMNPATMEERMRDLKQWFEAEYGDGAATPGSTA